MPLGSYANGTGNISAFTTNTNVIGYGTTFLTQLQRGAVIGNVSNVFVGYVSNINSNTSITLTTNGNVTINSNLAPTNYNYRPLTANVPNYVYYTTGNITANVNSAVVTGNTGYLKDTIFSIDSKKFVTNIDLLNILSSFVFLNNLFLSKFKL